VSTLAAQLKRLRAQAGARHAPPSAGTVAEPTPGVRPAIPDVADPALRRLLLDTLARRPPVRPPASPGPSPAASDRALPGTELAPGLHYREQVPGLAADAGDAPLELVPLRARTTPDSARRGQLLYFDTETTGLAGGTGTRAFMLGAADWHDGRLRVRQLWITRLAAEPAMLDAFRGWLGPDTLLVSYNGKSYDAPLLAARYRLARQDNPLAGLAHLDLLHPVRRRYRGAWENCRLATVERRLLAIAREDDLPGSEAPRAFLDYLRGGPAGPFRRVLAHNHQDVVTLALLLERLLATADADPAAAGAPAT